ncbi:hypothetical protein D9M71_322210 [compost metagenome]
MLVGGFLEGEAGAESGVVGRRVSKSVAFAGGAARIDVEQFGGHIANLFGCLALGFLPDFRTQPVQWRQCVIAAGIAGDQVQVGYRHIELGALGVFHGEEFGGLVVDFQGCQAQVAAHAVVDVHHRRAFAQLGEVLDHRVVAGVAAFFPATALHDALPEQRAFGHQSQGRILQQQAFVQGGDGNRQAFLAGDEVGPAVDGLRPQLQAFEQLQQHLAAPGRFGREQHTAGELVEEVRQRRQGLVGLGFDGQVGQRLGGKAFAGFQVILAGDDARPALEPGEAVFHRQEQLGRRQQWARWIDAALFVAVAHVAPELLGGLLDAGQGKHLGVLGQVIEQGRGFFEKQRQVVLNTGRRDAAAQVLEDRAAAKVHVKALAKARLELGHGFFLQGELARRQQAHRFNLVDRALGFRVEGAQGFDFIVEQVDPVRQFAAHREQVDQRAAHSELAVFVHRVDTTVATGFQARARLLHIELLADVQHQAAAQQKARRRQAMQGRGDRYHENPMVEFRQAVQACDALGDDVLVRREQVVGQGFPVGKVQNR